MARIDISNNSEYDKGRKYYDDTFGNVVPVKLEIGSSSAKWTWSNGKSYSVSGSKDFLMGMGDAYIKKQPNKVNSVFDATYEKSIEQPILPQMPKNVTVNTDVLVYPKVGVPPVILPPSKQATISQQTAPPLKSNIVENAKSWIVENKKLVMIIGGIALLLWFLKRKKRR